jgi:hypothetical protein
MATNWIVSNVSGTNEWFNPGNPTAQTPPASVGSGSYVQIDSGAAASGFTGYGATVYISGGGTLAGDPISGGTVYDSAGGDISGGTFTSGASVFASGGSLTGQIAVNSNAVVSGGTVLSGGVALADYGGTIVSALVLSSGTLYVSSSGVESGGTIAAGGMLDNFYGTDSGAIISSGGFEEAQGATVDGVTVDGGMNATLFTVVNSATVSSGGVLQVGPVDSSLPNFFDAVESGATLKGGTEFVYSRGTALADTIGGAGSLMVNGGAYVSAPTISGGSLIISSGATVSGPVTFASGTSGNDLVIGNTPPGQTELGGAAISGFASAGDTIDLPGILYSASYTMSETTTGTAVLGAGSEFFTFDIPNVPAGTIFTVVDNGGHEEVVGYCFLEGTRIATPEGEAAVQDLHEDDLVLTASGEAKPVRWIGYRHVVAAELPDAHLYAPVVIEAGAIAPGKPARDLWVTPDHAIFVEGRLIPAKLLVNGTTIRQETRAEFSYYHIELDQHDLLLAEGLEAESYLDVAASRQRFANHSVIGLRPDLSLTDAVELAYEERGVMPLSLREDAVKPVWEAIAARAEAIRENPAMAAFTDDPALHLLVAGRAVQPSAIDGGRYTFALPHGASRVVIASRSASPWASKPWIDDRRELGVAICSVTLLGAKGVTPVDLAGEAAVSGWYGPERDEGVGRIWRWTDGTAVLALPEGAFPRLLELTVCGTVAYKTGGADQAVAHSGAPAALSGLAA